MAERMDKRGVVSFEELLISNMYEQEALVLLLEEKGILTRGEVAGLMADLLASTGPSTGKTPLSDWISKNGAAIGIKCALELDRHYRL